MKYYNPVEIKRLTEEVKGVSSSLTYLSKFRLTEVKNEAIKPYLTPELASAYMELLREMKKCVEDYEKNWSNTLEP